MNFTHESLEQQIEKANYILISDDTVKYPREIIWSSEKEDYEGNVWFFEEFENDCGLYLTSVDEDGRINFFKKFDTKNEAIKYISKKFNDTNFSLHKLFCYNCSGIGHIEVFNDWKEEYDLKTCTCCAGKIVESMN